MGHILNNIRFAKNTFIWLSSLVIILFYAGALHAGDIKVRTGINYDWWEDDNDNKASQVYIPLRIETNFQQFSMGVITGYASTHITSGEEKKSLNSLLDTKVNTSYELSGNLPVDLLVGFDVNLPTGKTGLQTDDSKLIMDPDLISINNFGEGYDINPTLTVTKEMGNWVGGIGFGYAWRGTYDYIVKDFNPGDILNSSAEIRYSFSSQMTSRFFSNIALYGADKVDGKDFYREGDLLLLGIGLFIVHRRLPFSPF